ncbi:DNA-J related domain-containing protein [Vibrio sp. WXL103]|uniref:DNA-J related domain-containing protein n=1 Tax=Vibrio sp. WXL103 TaxID=3450710 RepID=UPI003EC629D5
MEESHIGHQAYFEDNPLVWPIYAIIKQHNSGWKVHTLAQHLQELGMMPKLDECSEKDLFKRNFLLMNALYHLQNLLYPQQWLQVQAMDICLQANNGKQCIESYDPLREYYRDWSHYDTDHHEVKRLLDQFWQRYNEHMGHTAWSDFSEHSGLGERGQALALFGLDETASRREISKRWRKLALRWHPDRDNGDSKRFRELCQAWSVLRLQST